MTRKQWISAVLIFGMVMLISPPANANAMIPVFVAGWFGWVLVLIPVILIESVFLMSIGAGVWQSLLAISTANLASTFAGLPFMIMLDAITLPYMVEASSRPYKDDAVFEWMIEVIVVMLLIAFFFLSWGIEAPIAISFLDGLPSQVVNLAVRDGNFATYSILAVICGYVLARAAWAEAKETEERRLRAVRAGAKEKEERRLVAKRANIEKLMYPAAYKYAREKANGFARRGMGKLRLAEIEIASKTATDDHIEHREVQTEPQAQRTDKTGASDILHDEYHEAETSLPVQTEDTDLAA